MKPTVDRPMQRVVGLGERRIYGDEKMETFQIIYMEQDTTPDGVRPPPQKHLIWQHFCLRLANHQNSLLS